MIAKGNLHGDGGGLARYLVTGEKGEIAQLLETRGLQTFGTDPVQAFALLQKIAEANTKSPLPFFHTQTRNAPGEHLTDAQWLQVADREEKRLGLSGQPRIVSFHIDPESGEKHMHAAWFRIDLETMRAIDSGMYKNHLRQLCRSLEKEFCLQEVSNVRKPDDLARAADRKEVEESRRLGTDIRAIRAAILDCFEAADGGKAFRAALDERGLMLANGDKRDCFVVVDQVGGHHALNKKLTGHTLAEIRDRLADLDRAQLPSVEQAQAMRRERHLEGERTPEPAAPIHQQPDASVRKEETRAGAGEPSGRPADRAEASAEFWSELSAWNAAARPADHAAREMFDGIEDALELGTKTASGAASRLAKAVENVLSGIFSFFGAAEPKLTPQQSRDQARAAGNEETLHARAYAAHEQQTEAERDERIFNQDRQQQQEDLAARYGVPGRNSAGRDRARDDDDYDRGRERER